MAQITLTLVEKDNGDGRFFYEASYNPEDLKPLVLALAADPVLSEVAMMALSVVLSREDNADALLDKIEEASKRIKHERSKVITSQIK